MCFALFKLSCWRAPTFIRGRVQSVQSWHSAPLTAVSWVRAPEGQPTSSLLVRRDVNPKLTLVQHGWATGGRKSRQIAINRIPLWHFNLISVVRKIKNVERQPATCECSYQYQATWRAAAGRCGQRATDRRLKTRKIRQADDEIVYKQAWRRVTVPTQTVPLIMSLSHLVVLQ